MVDRIDRYLEGAVERAALTPDEQAQADGLACAVEETRTFVSSQPPPDLTAAVMSRLEPCERLPAPPRSRRLLHRLRDVMWTPRVVSFGLRPAYAVLAAPVVVLLLLVSDGVRPLNTSPAVASASGEPQLFVQFRLQETGASEVRLAGSFTNWQPRHDLHETAPGIWTVTLALPRGVHDYVFVVDGDRWVADPYAPRVNDGFGGTNSRLALLPPDAPFS